MKKDSIIELGQAFQNAKNLFKNELTINKYETYKKISDTTIAAIDFYIQIGKIETQSHTNPEKDTLTWIG